MDPMSWIILAVIVVCMALFGPAENATKKQHRHR